LYKPDLRRSVQEVLVGGSAAGTPELAAPASVGATTGVGAAGSGAGFDLKKENIGT
jgi:hypothetical protein